MSPFRRLFGYTFRYRREFLIGLAAVVLTSLITLVSPMVLRYAIDDLTRGVTRTKLFEYAGMLLGVGLAGGVFRFLMRQILMSASRRIEYDLRNDFFAHLERLPLSYFQVHRTGDLMSRATNDLSAVRMMIGPAVMYTASTILTFVVALAMMLSIDARLTLVSLIPLPFVSLSVKYFGSAIHQRFETIQAQLSDISAVVQEALSGVRVVRAYRQEDAEMDRFRRANEEYLSRNRRLIVIQGFFFPSMSFFLGLGALLVLWQGSQEVIRGRITVGQFVAFTAYLTLLSWPMIAFGWVTNMVQRGMASWSRMLEVLDAVPQVDSYLQTQGAHRAPSSVDPPVPNADVHSIRGDIEFRDLVFGYDGPPVLNHVSAHIRAGETVALVGLTGSGKSTLISLLARLHEPPPGTVFLDGVDVREIPLSVLRGAIGLVPQEPFLFSDTIEDNVAFGMDRAGAQRAEGRGQRAKRAEGGGQRAGGKGGEAEPPSEGEQGWGPASAENSSRHARVVAASAVARLDKDVADFPKGYETMVGERGITLSGGQKQRTALARAIAVDPRILILDDALSAVDTYTEEEILSRLKGVMRERTSIVVSHRISTVRDADQILVLDRGRIVEQGTHARLLESGGLYADLHHKQLLEEELAAS